MRRAGLAPGTLVLGLAAAWLATQAFSNHFGTASALGSILIVAASVPLFLTYRALGDQAAARL